ncbi:putative benzoate transporter [Escherichia coli]|uniref:Putative benzoate transporter n=1 Tax=Escherichia coli TaxID=562 RepID=A0A3S4P5U5_ECOLX|nr:putative benzoate transporter [Escherichia coli]
MVNAGAALLVTGLQGLTLNEAIGVFIVTNALIVLCGITGLFARLMRIIPHSLAAAMLAGILLRFGLQAFASLDGPIYVVWQYVAGMAGNQGRCAALCGNCRDDYWDRDRLWRKVTLSQMMLSLNPFSPLILPLIFRLLTV